MEARKRLAHGIQRLTEVGRCRATRLGLVEHDHEGIGDRHGQRPELPGCVLIEHGFCDLCGNLSEFSAFIAIVAEEKVNDVELENRKKLELSHQYCNRHRPKLPNGEWNPVYRKAKRSLSQFEVEVARLSCQCARPSSPQAAASGDPLVDSYYYRYLLHKGVQPADKAALRNLARLMVDNKLSDTKKKCWFFYIPGSINQ